MRRSSVAAYPWVTVLAQKVLRKVHRAVHDHIRRARDRQRGTFGGDGEGGPLRRHLGGIELRLLAGDARRIRELADRFMRHEFDLLGSGWTRVRYGMSCRGLGAYRYEAGQAVEPDRGGAWLSARLNPSNVDEARRIWGLVDRDYVPIDWHRDFKSGYRWSEQTWYRDIRFGHVRGADIKVPWELARMQHLPQLAWAYALAKAGTAGFERPELYAREVRNQILDFIATNPPRFGVNWSCTMDVAIRTVNWLIAYDLLRSFGAEFDDAFEAVLERSIWEHARHIVQNLEWDPQHRANHYLANIGGLLFAAIFLPRTATTDDWLSFAVRELIAEVGYQFHADGSNFEASTCYHRLSAEIVAYSTALIVGVSSDKMVALRWAWDSEGDIVRQRLPLTSTPLGEGSNDRPRTFPPWYVERLAAMAVFSADIRRPDGRVVQIGDNDNGRFLNPSLETDALNHDGLIAAVEAVLGNERFSRSPGRDTIEAALVRALASGKTLHHPAAQLDRCDSGVRAYPDFGIYIFRSRRFFLAFRCGRLPSGGRGGHAHNDQLAIEVTLDDTPIIVDPGSYLYTPLPEFRNRFRSVNTHSTMALEGREQNPLSFNNRRLFVLDDHAQAEVIEVGAWHVIGAHKGFGPIHRRRVDVGPESIQGVDECDTGATKIVRFLLAPTVRATPTEGGISIEGATRGVRVSLRGGPGEWSIAKGQYSPSYGVIQETAVAELRSTATRITWSLSAVPEAASG